MPVSITPLLVGRCEWPALGEPLHVLLEIAPRNEHATAAGTATKTNVGTEPDDAPGVSAAGMLLSQNNNVIEVERHGTLGARRRHGREV
jgi:hypothetical protein